MEKTYWTDGNLVDRDVRAASRASITAFVFSSSGFTYVGRIWVLFAWPSNWAIVRPDARQAFLRTFYSYEHKTGSIADDDDYYRLGRIINKGHSPQNIFHLATEGLIEDAFSSWDFATSDVDYSPEDEDILYNFC